MIDSATLNAYPAQNAGSDHQARPRLHMRRDPDDRTAGSMPVWQSPVRNNAEADPGTFEDVINKYADMEPAAGAQVADAEGEEFGFGDLIDIVNPLHHIPLVSVLYESVTGDTIKPSGRIIGGAVFGGFAGAAAGIANVIIEEETGKDVAGNVVAMVTQGELPSAKPQKMSPEQQLDQAAELAFSDQIAHQELPAMAFGLQQPAGNKIQQAQEVPAAVAEYERYVFNDDRMAGTMVRRKLADTSPIPRTTLVDPASINMAASRAEQPTVSTPSVRRAPVYNE